VRIALVVVLLALAVLSLLFLLPSLKEGYDVEELALFGAVLLGLIALVGLAWLGLRGKPALLAVSLAGLSLPLVAYSLLVADIAVDEWRGRQLSRSVRILSLRETPIEWPGFDGPVGVRLEIELQHEVRIPGNLYAPKLRMAGPALPTRRDYFFGPAFGGIDNAFLQAPVFQNVGKPGEPLELNGSPARLSFDLYPWKVQRYEAGRKLCFGKWDAERVLPSAPGEELAACWMFAGRGGAYVDMSAPLTEALRARSRFQGKRAEWEALLGRLEPAGLAAHGFAPCGDAQAGERCYCAAASPL
jgi:hypothetical protein